MAARIYVNVLGGMITLESLIAGETVELQRVHKAIGPQFSLLAVAVAISYPLAGRISKFNSNYLYIIINKC